MLVVSGPFNLSTERQEVVLLRTYSRGVDVRQSGQLQHAVFSQDSLSLRVHERQGVDDDAQDGCSLPLVLHAHQLQEVPPVWQSEEDELCGLTKHPGVVGGQRHLVGVPEGRRQKDAFYITS